jgi:hypothetical protein
MPALTPTNTVAPHKDSRPLQVGFWLCIGVGVAIVLRRLIALQRSSPTAGPPEMARLDAWFQSHATLTYVHILTALLFLILLPLIFWQRTNQASIVRIGYYGVGAIVAITAYGMSVYSVGGWVERSAVLFFNTLFLITLGVGFNAWRTGSSTEERRWTLRSAATVLGIATARPVMGVFFGASRLTHWTPEQFFGFAIGIGFTINVTIIELWLARHHTPTKGNAQ